MYFYIDPGTGSMLFTILLGVLGAALYAFRNALVKLKFLFTGGRHHQEDGSRDGIVIFTDSKRYQTIFKPLCDEMEMRGENMVYLTASPDDPILNEKYEHIRSEFIGEGNKAFARMNFLKADLVLSSTPGLDVYQWKRSRDVKWYAHIVHMASDITSYRMFGTDYFDAILVSGDYQVRQIRDLEKLRKLPEREVVQVGLPMLDDLRAKLLAAEAAGGAGAGEGKDAAEKERKTVLVAPSWGPSGILNRYGSRIIDALLATDYHIVIRPHPQSMTSEKEQMDALMAKYPDSERLEWNFDNDNFSVLHRSDILISDFSGVIFDFALVFGKPVIYADVSFDNGIYDAWWLNQELWTIENLPRIGVQLKEEDFGRIGEVIDSTLKAENLRKGLEEMKRDTWVHIGESVPRIADYLVSTRKRLQAETVAEKEKRAEKAKSRKAKDAGALPA